MNLVSIDFGHAPGTLLLRMYDGRKKIAEATAENAPMTPAQWKAFYGEWVGNVRPAGAADDCPF